MTGSVDRKPVASVLGLAVAPGGAAAGALPGLGLLRRGAEPGDLADGLLTAGPPCSAGALGDRPQHPPEYPAMERVDPVPVKQAGQPDRIEDGRLVND